MDDEGILYWAEQRKSDISDGSSKDSHRLELFHDPKVREFVEWLQESDDDEDNEDGSEGEDDEDSEED